MEAPRPSVWGLSHGEVAPEPQTQASSSMTKVLKVLRSSGSSWDSQGFQLHDREMSPG